MWSSECPYSRYIILRTEEKDESMLHCLVRGGLCRSMMKPLMFTRFDPTTTTMGDGALFAAALCCWFSLYKWTMSIIYIAENPQQHWPCQRATTECRKMRPDREHCAMQCWTPQMSVPAAVTRWYPSVPAQKSHHVCVFSSHKRSTKPYTSCMRAIAPYYGDLCRRDATILIVSSDAKTCNAPLVQCSPSPTPSWSVFQGSHTNPVLPIPTNSWCLNYCLYKETKSSFSDYKCTASVPCCM